MKVEPGIRLKKLYRELEEKYFIDKREFGKVLLVASLAVLLVSVHAALEFQSASQNLDQMNEKFEETSGIINSESFNQSLQALETVRGTDIGPQFIQAAEAFRDAQGSIEDSREAEENLNSSFEIYQWLILVSILGTVSGAAIIYI